MGSTPTTDRTATDRTPRHRRRRVLTAAIVAATATLAVALYLFQPWQLFVDTVVDDALPTGVAEDDVLARTPAAAGPAASASPAVSGVPRTSPPASVASAVTVIGTGRFRSYEHETSGTATLFTTPDGATFLRLAGFETSNGPDVKVWLSRSSAEDAANARSAGYLDLGAMRGNRGNQNYTVPAGVDLSGYASVVIWCDRFSVPFGAAPLR